MATLQRLTGKVFAGNAELTNLGVFGSAADGQGINPTSTNTEAQIQADAAYEEGWTSAVVTSKNFPPVEEVNGVLRTISYQACYLLQEGIPTWDSGTVYSATSIVKSFSGNQLNFYKSLVDNNQGNAISDTTKWTSALIVGEREIGVPQITLDFNSSLPENCIDLQGQAVSRTTYNNLFAIYGTTYGAGDGSATFNLPDFSNRAIYGGTAAGYLSAALPKITATTNTVSAHTHSITSNGSHTHSRGSMEITGSFYGAGESSSNAKGAFYKDGTGVAVSNSGDKDNNYSFKASRTWSGETSSAGSHTHTIGSAGSHNHTVTLTPYVSGIYGNNSTVQPPAIKVRVFTRYK